MVNLQKIADFIKFKKNAEVDTALVADFKQLKPLLDEQLPDHCYLNDLLENPTAENLAPYLFDKAAAALKPLGLTLKTLELWENENAAAVWEGK